MFNLTEKDILESSVSEQKLDNIYSELEMFLIPIINIYSLVNGDSYDYITDISFDDDYIIVSIVGYNSQGECYSEYEIPINYLFMPTERLIEILQL